MPPQTNRPSPFLWTGLLLAVIFTTTPRPSAAGENIPGDVDANGIVDERDAKLIADHLLERNPLTSETLARADADADGRVRTADIAFVYFRHAPTDVVIQLPGDIPLSLVKIPAGSFQMGSPPGERGRYDDEGPVHTTFIPNNLHMGKYEITQLQWNALMGPWPGPSPIEKYGLGNFHPAYYISWTDARNFTDALNQHVSATGQGEPQFRLPSEAEWEYACRARTQTRFFFGDSLDADDGTTDGLAGALPGRRSDYMWFGGNNGPSGSPEFGNKVVGSKFPNAFGLFDMHGNNFEWCQDWHHLDYTGAPANGSAWEDPPGIFRVVRGGLWNYEARDCRSAARRNNATDSRNYLIGFRVVRAP